MQPYTESRPHLHRSYHSSCTGSNGVPGSEGPQGKSGRRGKDGQKGLQGAAGPRGARVSKLCVEYSDLQHHYHH